MLKVNDTVRTMYGRLARVSSTPRDAFGTSEISCVVDFQGGDSMRVLVDRLTKIEPTIRPVRALEHVGVALYGCHAVTVSACNTHMAWSMCDDARRAAKATPGTFGIWRVKHRHMPRADEG